MSCAARVTGANYLKFDAFRGVLNLNWWNTFISKCNVINYKRCPQWHYVKLLFIYFFIEKLIIYEVYLSFSDYDIDTYMIHLAYWITLGCLKIKDSYIRDINELQQVDAFCNIIEHKKEWYDVIKMVFGSLKELGKQSAKAHGTEMYNSWKDCFTEDNFVDFYPGFDINAHNFADTVIELYAAPRVPLV